MNDRADLAAMAHADGVHLGQDEIPVQDARVVLGSHALVGVSTHSIEQARQAVVDGANYLGCGPTFPSATKEFTRFPGVEFLRQISREIRLPAFAIGGINPANVEQVCAAGFSTWRSATVSSTPRILGTHWTGSGRRYGPRPVAQRGAR